MGLIYADIELVSAGDKELFRRNYLKESEIRKTSVQALVGSGAYMMCINEHIVTQLDLPQVGLTEAELADGSIKKVPVVGPLIVNFKNRTTSCNAIVMPGDAEVLLGSIPMEDLDVIIDPRKQTIEVNPLSPYIPKKKTKSGIGKKTAASVVQSWLR